MAQTTKAKRNQTLDIMKGFAMLMTIFCHAQQRAMGNDCVDTVIWQLVHWWHMPLFFIVSGLLAGRSSRIALSGGKFLKDKVLRLLWPWFVWRWLEWVFMRFKFSGLLPFNYYVRPGFIDNLKDFVLMPFRPMWFLFDLFILFVILTIIVQISKDNVMIRSILILAVTVLSVAFYRICIQHGVRGYDDFAFLYYDVQYVGLFFYGYLYGKHLFGRNDLRRINFLIVLISAILLIGIKVLGIDDHLGIFLFWTRGLLCTSLVGLACSAMAKSNSTALQPVKSSLSYIGRYSLEYYTLQFLFLDIGYAISNTYVRWAVNFIACMGICTALIVILKRIPVMDMILWGNFGKRKRA